jgi:hypothetical protein
MASAAPSRSDRTDSSKVRCQKLVFSDAKVGAQCAASYVLLAGVVTAADLGQPERKLSRTFRSGLSVFVSTSTTLCQVPSSGWPLSTGRVSDGEMKAGST